MEKQPDKQDVREIHAMVIKPFITGIVIIASAGLVAIVLAFAFIKDAGVAVSVASLITIACGGFIGQVLTLTRLTQIDLRINGRWTEAMEAAKQKGAKEEHDMNGCGP